MLGIRRASSNLLKVRPFRAGIARICYDPRDQLCPVVSGRALPVISSACNFFFSGRSPVGCRNLSSEVGRRSGDDDTDIDDGFSESEVPVTMESAGEKLDLLDAEADHAAKKGTIAPLLQLVMDAPSRSFDSVLDRFVSDGNTVGRPEASFVIWNLRKRRMYGKALKFSEWLESRNNFEIVEKDYASHLDLIAKLYGLNKAERYLKEIPEGFRGELPYRALLANYASTCNLKKSEEVFNKMRDLGFPLTAFTCSQLLLLYKQFDRKKIADVLLMMETENVKPNYLTYKILIKLKGVRNDIKGMEKVVESMNAEGVEPDISLKGMIAKYYGFCGHKEKAEAVLKEIEGTNIKKNRDSCRVLLPLYAVLQKADEVERVWSVCNSHPRLEECIAAIEAWGILGCIEKAEGVFEHAKKTWNKLPSVCYDTLLRVYANHQLLSKGIELAKQMSSDGCRIRPDTWAFLAKLHAEAGEVEKADSLLEKAAEHCKKNVMYDPYMSVLERYAKKGDVHNAEKIFHRLRMNGYTARKKMYQFLLEAYAAAKMPPYGFWERMKGDGIFPDRVIMEHLKTTYPFKKNQISELLAQL